MPLPSILIYDGSTWQQLASAGFVHGVTKPTSANTGHRNAVHNQAGDITVTTAGTEVTGLRLAGRVKVQAANVWVHDNEIIGNGFGAGTTSNSALVDCNHSAASNCRIEFNTLHMDPATATYSQNAIIGHDFTAKRNEMYDVVDGVGIYNTSNSNGPVSVTVWDNYIHDLAYFSPDPNHASDNHTHNDGIQIQGNSGISIQGNNIEAYVSSTTGNAISPYAPYVTGQIITLTPNVGAITGVDISYNWLSGGSRGIIAIVGSKGSSNIGTIAYNRIGDCRGNKIQMDPSLTYTIHDNVNDADGTPISVSFGTS